MSMTFDVVIVGGGIVGLSCALALKESGLSVAVLDNKSYPSELDLQTYDLRVSAITASSQQFLQSMISWPLLRMASYHKMHVWDEMGNGEINFLAHDYNRSQLGFIIENKVLRHALLESARMASHITLLEQVTLEQIAHCQQLYLLNGSHDLEAKLVIAADGANSWVRETLSFKLKSYDYHHHAMVATIQTEQPHQNTARQRFLTTGPLAFLPFADPHMCSIVWSSEPEHIRQLKAMDEAAFNKSLASAFEGTLGATTLCSDRLSFPLKMRHAKNYVGSQVALIGDAAHTIHPLAGQGLNLGLMDSQCLAAEITHAMQKSRDFAALDTLRRYQRARREANLTMILAMDLFKHLFSNAYEPLVQIRNHGLNFVDNASLLKRQFAKHAMGI